MPDSKNYDLAIIGGGIVGCATALKLTEADPGLRIGLFEKEPRLAAHQTGHNSGVIHAGLYYKPGSMKAETCASGREELYDFCREHDIPHENCGKVVVAVDESELSALTELERRGRANGLDGLEQLDEHGLLRHEPHITGIAGLHVPQTGIVDFTRVTETMADIARSRGVEIHLETKVLKIVNSGSGVRLTTRQGTFEAGGLVNCAGLHADRVARRAGVRPDVKIVPFRGEYYLFKKGRRRLLNNLVYPVPDPKLPFLGVHFTRMIDGRVEAGPNAVLALKREGYRRLDISPRDLLETLCYPGFWKLAARFWQVGIDEYARSFSQRRFRRSLQRLMPEISRHDLVPGDSGVRAQAVDRAGRLVDDFHILVDDNMIHVLNAPSPAATASLSIGRQIADEVVSAMNRGDEVRSEDRS